MAEEMIMPKRAILACKVVRNTIAERSMSAKPEKINQKLPTSSIVPKKDTSLLADISADRRKATTTPPPLISKLDRGMTILPSKNLAIPQKTKPRARPATKRRLLDISAPMKVNGRQKTGSNVRIKNNIANASRSKIFDLI